MSWKELVDLPCNVEGCAGKLEHKVAGAGSKIAGQTYLTCNNWTWHSSRDKDTGNPKGPFILANNATAVAQYLKDANAGIKVKSAAATTTSTTEPKRKYNITDDKDSLGGILLNILAAQQETNEILKRVKISSVSDNDDVAPDS